MSTPLELLQLVERIATSAADLLMDRPEQFHVGEKSGALDFATQMDHESERFIVDSILAARPDDGILGEEGAERLGSSGYTWVIDPIDGTVNYLYDLPVWCVSIAVKDASGVLAGVVVAPTIKKSWSAIRGAGAWCNGAPIRCNEPITLDRALVGTGFAYNLERRKPQAEFVANLIPKIRDIRRMGACAVDICFVASGLLDAHYESGVHEWDIAAAALIAREAGARVTTIAGIWDGEKYFVLAAGPTLYEALAAELAPGLGFPLT